MILADECILVSYLLKSRVFYYRVTSSQKWRWYFKFVQNSTNSVNLCIDGSICYNYALLILKLILTDKLYEQMYFSTTKIIGLHREIFIDSCNQSGSLLTYLMIKDGAILLNALNYKCYFITKHQMLIFQIEV